MTRLRLTASTRMSLSMCSGAGSRRPASYLAGPIISKTLKQAKDFWELRAKRENSQPHLLFYSAPKPPQQVNFVCCFKKSESIYKHAVEIAEKRRKQIEAGEELNVIDNKPQSQVH
jgi:hypothetical protein